MIQNLEWKTSAKSHPNGSERDGQHLSQGQSSKHGERWRKEISLRSTPYGFESPWILRKRRGWGMGLWWLTGFCLGNLNGYRKCGDRRYKNTGQIMRVFLESGFKCLQDIQVKTFVKEQNRGAKTQDRQFWTWIEITVRGGMTSREHLEREEKLRNRKSSTRPHVHYSIKVISSCFFNLLQLPLSFKRAQIVYKYMIKKTTKNKSSLLITFTTCDKIISIRIRSDTSFTNLL